MCGQIVQDNVDLLTVLGGDHLIHELEKFLGATTSKASAHDFAGGGVQRREQIRGSVAGVVMGPLFGLAECHRQQWLCPIQGLDLRLLVDRQHHGVHRRVEVEPDHIDHLLLEVRIGGELERPLTMRLKAVLSPQRGHEVVRNTDSHLPFEIAGHLPARPMRQPAVLRRRLTSQRQNFCSDLT